MQPDHQTPYSTVFVCWHGTQPVCNTKKKKTPGAELKWRVQIHPILSMVLATRFTVMHTRGKTRQQNNTFPRSEVLKRRNRTPQIRKKFDEFERKLVIGNHLILEILIHYVFLIYLF